MKKIISYAFLTVSLLIISTFLAHADIIDANNTRWPIPNWDLSANSEAHMHNRQCKRFLKYSTQSKKFLTEGLVVIKNGVLQFENYESKYNANTPHALWSVSKTITGALLGIAVRDGKISMDQQLNEFYPRLEVNENYQQIKIKNLFYLDTGFIWDEYYSGDVNASPVVNMLYGTGHTDIVNFASDREMIPEGPGFQWNYSTGTPVITMGVLKMVYGGDYDLMPWKSFFTPLNMTNVSFERDLNGVFNGGASVFATPRDMAKIGYLYLNRGKWNGKEILSEEWIKQTLQVSPGYLSNGTKIRDITDDGVYGGSIWLNKAVKPGFGKPYPTLPEDMFLALGHFGQMIIVLPTQNMVIARTGHDEDYNSRIDEFVSRAIACFDDPHYPIGKFIPAPSYTKSTLGSIFTTLKSGLQTNILQAAIAKNICSCHFISRIDVKTCLNRSNIPMAKKLAIVSIKKNIVSSQPSKLANHFSHLFGFQSEKNAQAVFNQEHPEFGCTLQ